VPAEVTEQAFANPVADRSETGCASNADVPQGSDETIDDYLSRAYGA
jgi:hypothetical protein